MLRKIYLSIVLSMFMVNCNAPVKTEVAKHNDNTRAYSQKAKDYCTKHKVNTDFYILIDLSIHSGLNRLYVWDFNKNEVTHSFTVSHGCANNPWGLDQSKTNATVSNAFDSHCSSIGKYYINERGYSNWGIHIKYTLQGLENTNRNAEKRTIVLHSWDDVPDNEVYPNGVPEGWGCPAVSNNAMLTLDKILKPQNKKTLLWIINQDLSSRTS